MTVTATHRTEHETTVPAPAARVYDIVADVAAWPLVFPPTVFAERVEQSHGTERVRIWATANGTVKAWTSRRELDRDGLRVTFRQEVSAPPVAAMGGEWVIEPLDAERCRVRLLHDFSAVDDDAEHVGWIIEAVERNSGQELAALRRAAPLRGPDAELELSFDDTVRVAGPAAAVYEFLHDVAGWPDRLPHVARVELDQRESGIQLLDMDTRTADGATHTTSSVRVCLPPDRIVYKQVRTPALMRAHTGAWTVRATPGGCEVTSAHGVVLNRDTVGDVLGPGADVARARQFVRDALGRNSTTTMLAAKAYAERQAGR